MRQKILLSVFICLAACTLSLLIPHLLFSTRQSEQKNRLVCEHIYDELTASIEKPLVISNGMRVNSLLKKALKDEAAKSEEEMQSLMASYLAELRDTFGYVASFVISDSTRRYYTPRGIEKIVNPLEDPHDGWYKLFVDSKLPYKLDTDRDQLYDYRWVVFVNTRIADDDGSLLGVCGVGVFMDDLQKLASVSEKAYGVKVNLINASGLVQVDTDSANIESAYISDAIKDKAGSEAFVYTPRSMGRWRMTRYVQSLGWYLVVQNFSRTSSSKSVPLAVGVLYALFLLMLLVTLFKKKEAPSRVSLSLSVTEDPLTKLPNRNYMRDSYGEEGIFNTTRYKSLVMFDIDHFKSVNETRDGNRILVDIVALTKKAVGECGIMFRWAGDEFVLFLEMECTEAETVFARLCAEIQSSLAVTISVGIVEVDLTESIKTNYHRAVEQCYNVKANGGNGVRVQR